MNKYIILFFSTFCLFASGRQEIIEFDDSLIIDSSEIDFNGWNYYLPISYSVEANSEVFLHALGALEIEQLVFNAKEIKPKRGEIPVEFDSIFESFLTDSEIQRIYMPWRFQDSRNCFRYYSVRNGESYIYTIPAESGIVSMSYRILLPCGTHTEMQIVQWNQVVP